MERLDFPVQRENLLERVAARLPPLQQKCDTGQMTTLDDIKELQMLVSVLPDLYQIAVDRLIQERLPAEALTFTAIERQLIELLLSVGRRMAVDLSPVVRQIRAWEFARKSDLVEISNADATRMALDARLAWDAIEAAVRCDTGGDGDRPQVCPEARSRSERTRDLKGERLSGLLDEVTIKVLQIAENEKMTTEDRLSAISTLDQRFWGKDSNELGGLLGVTPGMIRQTNWWKVKRPKQLEYERSAVDFPNSDDT